MSITQHKKERTEELSIHQQLLDLPSDAHYASYSRAFLDSLKEFKNVWRFEELPLFKRRRLNLEKQFAEGIAEYEDGTFSFWISYRLPGDYLSRFMLKDILQDFNKLKKSDERIKKLLIITTALEVDDVLANHPLLSVYTLEDQEERPKVLKLFRPQVAGAFKLYPHQKEDFDKIMFNIKPEGSRQLFEAYCGYGKTNIFIEMTVQYHRKNPNDLVILVFPLLNIQNQTVQRFHNHNLGIRNYDPLRLCFSSSSVSGVYHSTEYQVVRQFMDEEEGPKIIFTTYKSFNRLIRYLPRDKIPLIVLDEAHNFSSWDLLDSLNKTNFVAFTATPLQETRDNFELTVSRELVWSVAKGYSCDFELVSYGAAIDPAEIEPSGRMIKDLFRHRLTTKLLVIASTMNDIFPIYQYLKKNSDILCHLVTANDSQKQRRQKEKEIEEAEQGILLSMRIYREGIDFPWMDGLFLLCNTMQQYQIVQSTLRVSRTSPLKKKARIFVPYFLSTHARKMDRFNMFSLFASFQTKYSVDREEKNTWFFRRIRIIEIDQRTEVFRIAPLAEIAEIEKDFMSYCDSHLSNNLDRKLKAITWMSIAIHAILILFDTGNFYIPDLLKHTDKLAKFKLSRAANPEGRLLNTLDSMCRLGLGYIDKDVFYFDRYSLIELVDPTPRFFPITEADQPLAVADQLSAVANQSVKEADNSPKEDKLLIEA